MAPPAFLSPPGARMFVRPARRPDTSPQRAPKSWSPRMTAEHPSPRKLPWMRLALIAAGSLTGAVSDLMPMRGSALIQPPVAHSASQSPTVISSDSGIPLRALGIKRDDYVSERELRRRKTTQYSEAEEEIMELEEWEVATQWFRDLQMTWAALASVGGIFVLYKGGVMWEKWIQEQERKDMEEEIELTGTFIDPRAVRKEEDDDTSSKGGTGQQDRKGPSGEPDDGSGTPPSTPDYPSDGLDSLEKLFGKS